MFKQNLPGIGLAILWMLCIAYFWTLMDPANGIGFSFMAIFLALPLGALAAGYLYGRRWRRTALWFILFAAILGILLPWLTFDLANTVSTGTLHLPELFPALLGGVPAALGLGLGYLTRRKPS